MFEARGVVEEDTQGILDKIKNYKPRQSYLEYKVVKSLENEDEIKGVI